MIYEFGHNCNNYLPTLQKCRKLIDQRRIRMDLVEQKWLSTRDALDYLNLTNDAFVRGVVSGEIKAKGLKNRKLMFRVSVASQYDDCFLKDSGGVCLYFEKHSGPTISCLADIERLDSEHPNRSTAPSETEIRTLENEIAKLLLEQRKNLGPDTPDGL